MKKQKCNLTLILLSIFLYNCGSLTPAKSETQQAEEPAGLYLTWQQDPLTTMTIDWHIEPGDAADPTIRYKMLGTDLWQEAQAQQLSFPYSDRSIQRVELVGLEPGTKYRFQVGEFSRLYKFHTMPERLTEPIRFATGGDIRHEYEWMVKTNNAAMEYNLDFIVWGGDLAYVNGDPARTYRWYDWFDAIKNTLITEEGRVVPIIVAIGNHEQFYTSRLLNGTYPHDNPMTEAEAKDYKEKFDLYNRKVTFFFDLFAFPGEPAYNVLDFGQYMSLITLDTDHHSRVEGEQTLWLEEVLAKRKYRPHIFPVYHVPAFPAARPYDGSTSTRIRENWVPLFEQYGVRLAFENHDHRYKRTPPIRNERVTNDGIVYLGDGGWGVDMDSEGSNRDEWFIKEFGRERHAIIVTVHGPHQHILVVSEDGEILDEYPKTPAR